MKQKIILLCVLVLGIISFFILKPSNKVIKNDPSPSENTGGMISVLVDGVEQSAFPSKGSAEYQSTSCTNGETAVWDATNWKLSIQDISASTRCVVSFVTGGHNVYVSVSGGTVDSAPKNVAHNGNVTFTVAASNSNYVFSSAKCSGANGYSWANNVLSVNGVVADAYCDVVFSRPTYTVYFNVVGGYTEDNYLTVVRGGGNSTTFGAVPGYLVSGSSIECDSGISGKITGSRVVISNVLASGDCTITCAKDSSSYLPGGVVYNPGDEVSYANLAWQVVKSDSETVTLILKQNATYISTSSSNELGTGIFGSGVTYTSSSARSYLVDIWLEQDAQKYLRNAIDSEGLKYQDDANGFIRLPYAAEVSKKIPNASGTNFWTMDNDGNGHVYYGQPNGYLTEGKASNGKYYYEYYTLATNASVNYSWTLTITGATGYWSTTCGSDTDYYTNTESYGYRYRVNYCDATNGKYGKIINSGAGIGQINVYMACSGGSYYDSSPDNYCTNTCTSQTPTCSHNISSSPTFAQTQTNGSKHVGYKFVNKNVAGSEVKSSVATLNTTLTYGTTTSGNSGMTTGIQAVLPTGTTARYNDSAPTTASVNVSSGTKYCDYYQGAGTSSCNSLRLKSSGSKAYTTYTLNQNTQTMGYRPVIQVYKSN